MAIRHLASRTATWIRCRFRDHELVTDLVPAKPAEDGADAKPAKIRLRCLHCRHVTAGWEQGEARYRRTQEAGNLALPNPRLEAAQAAAQAQVDAAEPVAAAGGDNRRNVTKFPLARKRRSR
jgi:hypothetical protein